MDFKNLLDPAFLESLKGGDGKFALKNLNEALLQQNQHKSAETPSTSITTNTHVTHLQHIM